MQEHEELKRVFDEIKRSARPDWPEFDKALTDPVTAAMLRTFARHPQALSSFIAHVTLSRQPVILSERATAIRSSETRRRPLSPFTVSSGYHAAAMDQKRKASGEREND